MIGRDDTFVVLIDVQEKLLRAMHEQQAVLANTIRLIKGAKILGLPVIWLEQNPNGLGPTDPALAEILAGQEPIVKFCFSCYGNPEFKSAIESLKRTNALVCGIESHVCVYQTAVDLKEAGYCPEVVFDATSSRRLESKMIALESLKAEGIKITSVETALFELLKVAGGDEFKEILAVIK